MSFESEIIKKQERKRYWENVHTYLRVTFIHRIIDLWSNGINCAADLRDDELEGELESISRALEEIKYRRKEIRRKIKKRDKRRAPDEL